MGKFFLDFGAAYSLSETNREVSDEDLKLINKLKRNGPLAKLEKDDVIVRNIYVLGTEPTMKMSIHPEGMLNGKNVKILSEIGKKLPGAPMMEGHRTDKIPWGRCFKAEVVEKVKGYSGPVLKVGFYFVNDEEGVKRARNIDAGILAEVSISYWFEGARCSICHGYKWGVSLAGKERCPHITGEKDPVTKQIAYWYPYNIAMVGEISYVFRGAYRKTKSLLKHDYELATYAQDEVLGLELFYQKMGEEINETQESRNETEKENQDQQTQNSNATTNPDCGQEQPDGEHKYDTLVDGNLGGQEEMGDGVQAGDEGAREELEETEAGSRADSACERVELTEATVADVQATCRDLLSGTISFSDFEDCMRSYALSSGCDFNVFVKPAMQTAGFMFCKSFSEANGAAGQDGDALQEGPGGEESAAATINKQVLVSSFSACLAKMNKSVHIGGTALEQKVYIIRLCDSGAGCNGNETPLPCPMAHNALLCNLFASATNAEPVMVMEGGASAFEANAENEPNRNERGESEAEPGARTVESASPNGNEGSRSMRLYIKKESPRALCLYLQHAGEDGATEGSSFSDGKDLAEGATNGSNESSASADGADDREGTGGTNDSEIGVNGREGACGSGEPFSTAASESSPDIQGEAGESFGGESHGGSGKDGAYRFVICENCDSHREVALNYDGSVCSECGEGVIVEENSVVFKRVKPVKPSKSGTVNNEFFKIEDFKGLPDGNYYVDPKYDGVWFEAHRDGDKVKLISDEGNEHTEKFPGIVKELKDSKAKKFIIVGEMVKFRGRQRLPHDDVTAWLHTKQDKYNDKDFRLKPFDMVHVNGKSMELDGYGVRRKALDSHIKWGSRVHPTSYKKVKHKEGGSKIVSVINDRATREGSMIKSEGHTYNNAGRKGLWKWKRQFEVDCKVLSIKDKKGGGWVYTCGVGDGKKQTTIGETFATKIKAAVGDIITVTVDKVIYDAAAKKYSWFAPKVVRRRTDKKKADPLSTLDKIAVKKGTGDNAKNFVTLGEIVPLLKRVQRDKPVWLVGSVVEHGITANDIDIVSRYELSSQEKQDILGVLGERISSYVEWITDKDGPAGPSLEILGDMAQEHLKAWKHSRSFVLQEHGWGNKRHYDLRFGAPRTPRMWGWTILSKPPTEAGTRKARTMEKKYHDPKWMDVNKRGIKPGEPGHPGKDTYKGNAYMVKIDDGSYKFVRRKPGFLEVILDGKKYKGRYLFREIEVKANKSLNGIDGDEVGVKSEKIWVMWKPKEQEASKPIKKMAYDKRDGMLMYWELDEVDEYIESADEIAVESDDLSYDEM